MVFRTVLLVTALFISTNSFAIDVKPYKIGQTLTKTQGDELRQRYKEREEQPWLEPKDFKGIDATRLKQIKYGIQLLADTVKTIGPKVADKDMRYSANGLNCSSCHLKGASGLPGTKFDAIPYTNVMNDYPNFRSRSMSIGSAADRVNGCLTRSMSNGRPLPVDSKEMKAILAYFSWLSEGSNAGLAMKGISVPKLKLPNRKADPVVGKTVFQKNCQMCHGVEGSGMKAQDYAKTGSYQFPPLAGDDSFNDAAGMSRLIKASEFIRANMPLGVSSSNPKLSIDEAYDVASYVLSLPRPNRAGRDKDYPDTTFRPIDYPVPEFYQNDKKGLERAQLGPFSK